MNKRTGWRTEQTVKRFCRVLTAAMLILLLFILSIPSVIALENETNILPDSDIPETFNQINESTPTAGMLHFDSVSGLKQWLATSEGNERYKTVYYDDGSGQNCKDNIDALIKNVRENGILVPYVNGQDAVNMCSIYIPDGKGWPASVYFDTEINGVKYRIGMTYIPQENKQYTQAGYVEYKTAVMGTVYNDEYIEKFGQYIPARIRIGATEYDAALKQSPYNGRNSVYAIIDGWDVSIEAQSGDRAKEDVLEDIAQLAIKNEALHNYAWLWIVLGAVSVGAVAAVIVLKKRKQKERKI